MGKLLFKEEFDQLYPSALSAVMIGCWKPKCSVRSDAKELMRCSACLMVVYCTKACQKEDWPTHRKHCKEAQRKLREGLSMPLHLHDRNFINYQTSRDFFRHKDIVEDIKAHWPSPGQDPLCLEIDYLEVPPKLFVQSVYSFNWEPDYDIGERDRYLAEAKQALNKRYLLICVIIRDGHYKHRYPMLFDIDHQG